MFVIDFLNKGSVSKALVLKDGETRATKQVPVQTHCVGVMGILDLDNAERSSEIVDCSWQYPDGTTSNNSEQTPICQYKSEQRYHSLNSKCMLGNISRLFCRLLTSFKIYFFKKFFWEHYQSVRQFGSRSGPTFCRS